MNTQEAVFVCRLVKAACPAQKFDEYTPDIWGEMLKSVDFEAAKTAIVEVGKRQPWIAPSDIIAEVRRITGGQLPYHRPMRDVLAELEQTAAADNPLELER